MFLKVLHTFKNIGALSTLSTCSIITVGDIMNGIDLNKPIAYKHASLRFFNKNEHHIDRFCEDDVLLLVFDGVLRFSEDGVNYEVFPGKYHIQQHNTFQKGDIVSDSPKYLYVHFLADWSEDDDVLPACGDFNYEKLKPMIADLDRLSHSNSPIIEQTAKFFELLLHLYHKETKKTTADQICDFITEEYTNNISLEMLCDRFHFSKNHIINIFKNEYHMTPFEYANSLKIKQAEYLLETTSDTIDNIARQCGFNNYSHFYRLSYRKHALSPDKWRSKKRIHPAM